MIDGSGEAVISVLIILLIVVAILFIWPLALRLSRGHAVREDLEKTDGIALMIYWISVFLFAVGIVLTLIRK